MTFFALIHRSFVPLVFNIAKYAELFPITYICGDGEVLHSNLNKGLVKRKLINGKDRCLNEDVRKVNSAFSAHSKKRSTLFVVLLPRLSSKADGRIGNSCADWINSHVKNGKQSTPLSFSVDQAIKKDCLFKKKFAISVSKWSFFEEEKIFRGQKDEKKATHSYQNHQKRFKWQRTPKIKRILFDFYVRVKVKNKWYLLVRVVLLSSIREDC